MGSVLQYHKGGKYLIEFKAYKSNGILSMGWEEGN